MIAKNRRAGNDSLWLAILLLFGGILIGGLLDPVSWVRSKLNRPTIPAPHLQAKPEAPVRAENGLPTLTLSIAPEDTRVIQAVRDAAIEKGVIVQQDTDTVPATVGFNGEERPAEARIKGDWTDHIQGEKWSFRIRLKDSKILGMRTFSVQDPRTRGYLWEWLIHQAARREGILAPRSSFVNLVVNNNPIGVCFLEEHFSKELIESQGRREGPIVIFDESSVWSTYLQHHLGPLNFHPKIPTPLISATMGVNAEVRAYGEKHLTSVDSLNRAMVSALKKMREIQRLIVVADRGQNRLKQLNALQRLQGRTIERLVDPDWFARAHALYSVFQVWHGLVWHNQRYYFNPVTDRLEPVIYDNMPNEIVSADPIIFSNDTMVRELAKSSKYQVGFYAYLGRFCEPEWLESLFAEIGPEMAMIERALNQESALAPAYLPEAIKQRLRAQQIHLKPYCEPGDPVNFNCWFRKEESEGGLDGVLEIEAWSTTGVPVIVRGFRFGDGSMVSALSGLSDDSARPFGENEVILPLGGASARFSFSLNRRLANLSNITEIKDSIRRGSQGKSPIKIDEIRAVFRTPAERIDREETLVFRPYEAGWLNEGGRPAMPSLKTLLENQPCLYYNVERDMLSLRPGVWTVERDLLIPEGYSLTAPAGVVLRFAEDAVLLSESPLFFTGTPDQPVVLEPVEGAASWGGVVVLNAGDRSEWRHVTVRKTNSIARAGWTTTGGITFYHAPVTMTDCLIEGTLAEDGTNIFGADFLLDRVTFSGCESDSFDGDFVTGTIRDSVFRDGKADGVDLSGSNVLVEGSQFLNLGDKGLSIGENSTCRVVNCQIEATSIGIAAKDLSEVSVSSTQFRKIKHYAFAVFVKKPEFGPAKVTADGVVIGSATMPYLVQTGSSLSMDGRLTPTQNIDVNKLYDEKILGN